jgi:hypothetical protein
LSALQPAIVTSTAELVGSNMPFILTTREETKWHQPQLGMAVRIYNGDTQCIADPNNPTTSSTELAWCMDIRSEEQLQLVLRSNAALRTGSCGLERTWAHSELVEWNRTDGWDPAGYSSPRWCRTVKALLKGTGE